MIPNIRVRVDQSFVRDVVPGHVFRQPPFEWRPRGKDRHAELECESLARWRSMPIGAMIFMLTAYDQQHAEYAAAELVQIHMQRQPNHLVLWLQIHDHKLDRYTGQFPDPIPHRWREADPPTLIVCTGFDDKATDVQCEKVRDVRARYESVPMILCGSGLGYTPHDLHGQTMLPMHAFFHILPLRPHEQPTDA
jgi:hypothetical protein